MKPGTPDRQLGTASLAQASPPLYSRMAWSHLHQPPVPLKSTELFQVILPRPNSSPSSSHHLYLRSRRKMATASHALREAEDEQETKGLKPGEQNVAVGLI